MHMTKYAALVLMLPVTTGLSATPAEAQTTVRPPYGCFKVTAKSLDLREKSNRNAIVVGTVAKGNILVKAGRFCTAGGNWCFVTTEKGVQGYADKSKIAIAACPARLSKPN